jgi:hypothetical protein
VWKGRNEKRTCGRNGRPGVYLLALVLNAVE